MYIDRISLIQYLIKKYKFSKYLEIGTQKGESFFPVVCKKKVAVDPEFKIDFKNKIKWYLTNLSNFKNVYFQMTSDDFFQNHQSFLKNKGRLDIVLIDGLHTFSATLKDSLNCLDHLSRNGIIVLHDCYPPHKAASIYAENAEEAIKIGSAMEGWTGEWCGDSWKAIVYLREKYKECLEVFVLESDYGLGVIKVKKDIRFDLEIDEELFRRIDSLQYEDLSQNSSELIGLKPSSVYMEL